MAIDDIGINPTNIALEIHRQLDNPFGRIPLYEIATDLGIKNIVEKKLTNIEGALLVPEGKAYGEILLNTGKDLRRTHFTLAHELGHYLHPLHHGAFGCQMSDLSVNHNANNRAEEVMEAQANEFASELVMPTLHLQRFYNGADELNCKNIVSLSDELFVSREALFRKIADKNHQPVAVYFIKNKKIRYFRTSAKFPNPKIWPKQNVPVRSISNSYDGQENSASKTSSNAANQWLRNPYGHVLIEQTFRQENGYQITLLKLL